MTKKISKTIITHDKGGNLTGSKAMGGKEVPTPATASFPVEDSNTAPTPAQRREASDSITAWRESQKESMQSAHDLAQTQAEDTTTAPEILAKSVESYFIFDKFQWMLECVASNPSTSPETLDKLSKHTWPDIRTVVAGNPHTSPATLASLIEPQLSIMPQMKILEIGH